MEISPELTRALESRFTLHVDAENAGDVSVLYGLIDPKLRAKREHEYEFEPEHTLSQLQEFVAQINSAAVDSFTVEQFVDDGGPSRNHRPTAIVVSRVIYNGTQPSDFRTPWVRDNGVWYTRSLGRHKAFCD